MDSGPYISTSYSYCHLDLFSRSISCYRLFWCRSRILHSTLRPLYFTIAHSIVTQSISNFSPASCRTAPYIPVMSPLEPICFWTAAKCASATSRSFICVPAAFARLSACCASFRARSTPNNGWINVSVFGHLPLRSACFFHVPLPACKSRLF